MDKTLPNSIQPILSGLTLSVAAPSVKREAKVPHSKKAGLTKPDGHTCCGLSKHLSRFGSFWKTCADFSGHGPGRAARQEPHILWVMFRLCARRNICKDFGAENCTHGRGKCCHAASRTIPRGKDQSGERVKHLSRLLNALPDWPWIALGWCLWPVVVGERFK